MINRQMLGTQTERQMDSGEFSISSNNHFPVLTGHVLLTCFFSWHLRKRQSFEQSPHGNAKDSSYHLLTVCFRVQVRMDRDWKE